MSASPCYLAGMLLLFRGGSSRLLTEASLFRYSRLAALCKLLKWTLKFVVFFPLRSKPHILSVSTTRHLLLSLLSSYSKKSHKGLCRFLPTFAAAKKGMTSRTVRCINVLLLPVGVKLPEWNKSIKQIQPRGLYLIDRDENKGNYVYDFSSFWLVF